MNDLTIIGGGAAGIFAAISAKEARSSLKVAVLEKNNVLLSKVRVSGGGRCNVTHACFDPYQLVKNYPRGYKELIGPFHQFQPRDTVDWFEKKGVSLKIESDGRIFPTSDSSATIIDCLLNQAHFLDIKICLQEKIDQIRKDNSQFVISLKNGEKILSKYLILATGSSKEGYTLAKYLGHSIKEPVPSLFTFNIPFFSLQQLSGISIENAQVKITNSKYVQNGPLLITHFGFSGPVILKLSAWEARFLHDCNYSADVTINWLNGQSEEKTFQALQTIKEQNPHKLLTTFNPYHLPKNLWKTLLEEISEQKLHIISHKRLRQLAHKFHTDIYHLKGKTTNKEEFVTCGGVCLKEIDFKTMQSKKCPGLFFAGEILDIDGITGGFNFQNAWTTGYIAGKKIALC